ncbi:Gfo/Idh/MocA family protein [Nonomuraea diastatica]|nr:Gfo/Idh/MocA family oxidoreductase [Nonomuraea diastatica]
MPVRLGVLGAGSRGRDSYGRWIVRHPERARIAAVADPIPDRRDGLAAAAGVPDERRYHDWKPLLADAEHLDLDGVIVALPDRDHVAPTLEAARRGLAVLVEKPVSSTPAELEQLADGGSRLNARISVGHVMRYQPFWQTLHQLVAGGAIGRLVTMRIEENIGFWHFAHSYVRGNWRNSSTSSPMVLAKTCHDLDVIRWFAGSPPVSVSSVGELTYFRPENAPPGAPERCLDGCPHADDCPFYAPRYYVDALRDVHGSPVALLGADTSPEGRLRALEHGPYGRCVFGGGNNVVDHQQTVMSFPGGLTATLSTSAFTGQNTRTVRLTGTGGEIAGHVRSGSVKIDLFSPSAVLPELPHARDVVRGRRGPLRHQAIELLAGPAEGETRDHRGHSGGDDGLMDAFVSSLTGGGAPATSLEASLDSHRMAFAAERSRLEGRTVLWGEA